MIQVIKRVFSILEILAPDEGIPLKHIAEKTNLNKATLCNILRTLINIGYVTKTGLSQYAISKKFLQIAYPQIKKDTVLSLAEEHTEYLAEQTKEASMAAISHKGEIMVIAKSVYNRSVIINTQLYNTLSWYGTVSGRIILAFLKDAERKKIIKKKGLPDDSQWKGASSPTDLIQELKTIRNKRIIIKRSTERHVLAVPVLWPDNSICASLALIVPSSRFTSNNKRKIVEALENAGERMSYALSISLGN